MKNLKRFAISQGLVMLVALGSFIGDRAQAEATFMKVPKWTQCNHQQICFSLSGVDAASSYLMPDRLFFRKVKFKLYGAKNRKVAQTTLVAASAFSSDHDRIWYLQNAKGGHDYSFDTGTMKLTRLGK